MRSHKAVLAALLLICIGAAGAESADYKTEYKLYNEALNTGDQAGAAIHAKAAWDAAEAQLGDDKTTATLAYKYGQLVLFDDPKEVLPALLRAKVLQGRSIADLPVRDLTLFLAFAQFKAAEESEATTNWLKGILEKRKTDGIPPTWEYARIWLDLARHYLDSEAFEDLTYAAIESEAAHLAAAPTDINGRAIAMMYQGIAKLLPKPRTGAAIDAAQLLFLKAFSFYPPENSIDSVNPVAMQAYAWRVAAYAALQSLPNPSRIDRKLADNWPEAGPVLAGRPSSSECQYDWIRTPPNYPYKARTYGRFGAVLIGFRITDRGRVKDQRILAEVPRDLFGSYSLLAMRSWRVKNIDHLPSACHGDAFISICFSLG